MIIFTRTQHSRSKKQQTGNTRKKREAREEKTRKNTRKLGKNLNDITQNDWNTFFFFFFLTVHTSLFRKD